MKKTKFPAILFIGLFLFSANIRLQAQYNHLLPVEIKNAYQKGTRSFTGKAGPQYWQNNAHYTISAQLFPGEKRLKGDEKVVYFNNSPDTLYKLVIRLYPDLFKIGALRDWPMDPKALNEGTMINFLKLNGTEIDLNDPKSASRSSTNLQLFLKEWLVPGDSITMEAGWEFYIESKRPVRTGYYGKNIFFISYWYPQIAVYDDIDGWDEIEYSGTVEFYNDFNDFDVTMQTPGKYMVWATGDLLNEQDLFTPSVIKKLNQAKKSDEVVNIMSCQDCRNGKVLKNNRFNSWHFTAKQVPDFSFGTVDAANWDGSSLMVDPVNERKIFIDAVYPDSSRSFDTVAQWGRNSIEYLSQELPGYPYPYSHMTLFDNNRRGGGMETPMMVNLGDTDRFADEASTVFHEIAHTYFPFFMGINERKYAWMDEGWAAFLPAGFMEKYYPNWDYEMKRVNAFENFNGREKESNLITLSYLISAYDSYRNHAYNRPAVAYYFLKDALGDSVFKNALLTYMTYWNGKHPVPYDFFNTFSNSSNQNLDWFFTPWFYTRAQADHGIRKVTFDNKIVVEDVGGLPMPVALQVEYQDGKKENYYKNTSVWRNGDPAIVIQANKDKKIKQIKLGSRLIPDINTQNNQLSPVYE